MESTIVRKKARTGLQKIAQLVVQGHDGLELLDVEVLKEDLRLADCQPTPTAHGLTAHLSNTKQHILNNETTHP